VGPLRKIKIMRGGRQKRDKDSRLLGNLRIAFKGMDDTSERDSKEDKVGTWRGGGGDKDERE